jgi:hypothetical protein
MELTLSSNERELLLEILEEHHRELLREISRAEHHEFKSALQSKAKLLERMLEKLKATQPTDVLLRSA